MTYDNRGPRQMYQGNWTCSKCGKAITELPFEPKGDRIDTLQCRDCYTPEKRAPRRDGGFQKQMYQGNWTCGKCGGAITELPFQPSPDRIDQLSCKSCFVPKKRDFGGGRY